MRKFSLDANWKFIECDAANPQLVQMSGAWRSVDLPHDAALSMGRSPDSRSGFEEGYTHGASLYYKREIHGSPKWRGKTLILEFEGVMGIAEVIVNGNVAAKHFNGYTGFIVDLSERMNIGSDNTLLVRVENSQKPSSRWYAGTGIYRHVWLHVGGGLHIRPWDLSARTLSLRGDHAAIEVMSRIRHRGPSSSQGSLQVRILDPQGAVAARSETAFSFEGRDELDIPSRFEVSGAHAWSVDSPALYRAEAEVVGEGGREDGAATAFGIRVVEMDSVNGLRLNGTPLKLKGGCIHHDSGILGSASYDAAERRKAELLKASGFNALRLAHGAHAPAFLDACDQLGLLVIDEAFDSWIAGRRNFDYHLFFEDHWEEDLSSLIRRDYNHPCVIMWSIGNEVEERDGSSDGYAWSRRLADEARKLDPGRAVTASACSLMSDYAGMTTVVNGNVVLNMLGNNVDPDNDNWGERTEGFFEPLDASGYNYKVKRYKYDRSRFPDRVIYGSETYPQNVIENWEETLKNPNVIGDFVWTAMDYLGEAGLGRVDVDEGSGAAGGAYPWLLANCGDIDILGEKRPQSYFRDVVWGARAEPYIAVLPPALHGRRLKYKPWGWEPVERSYSFPGDEGKPIRVDVYSAGDEVELLLDGKSLGRKPAGPCAGFLSSFEIGYAPGRLEACRYEGGKAIARDALESAGHAVGLRLRPGREPLSADRSSILYISIEAVDEAGRIVPFADDLVSVEVGGAAELIAYGTADPKALELFSVTSRRLYRGRALAVMRSSGKLGTACFIARSDSLGERELSLRAEAIAPPYESVIDSSPAYSLDMTLGQLLGDRASRAVMERHLGSFLASPMIEKARDMSFRALIGFAKGLIPKGSAESIEEELRGL